MTTLKNRIKKLEASPFQETGGIFGPAWKRKIKQQIEFIFLGKLPEEEGPTPEELAAETTERPEVQAYLERVKTVYGPADKPDRNGLE